jgi:hypothetical protein
VKVFDWINLKSLVEAIVATVASLPALKRSVQKDAPTADPSRFSSFQSMAQYA